MPIQWIRTCAGYIRASVRRNRERANLCLMKRQRNPLAKREKDGVFSLFMERKQERRQKRRRNLEMVIIFCQISLPHHWSISLSGFKLLFDSHGATHPTREQREPCFARLVEEKKAPTGPECAGQVLDWVELG